ncbi:MAG: hypothetical protein LBO80_07210 [Treponema sp.]|jgi:hypothetical protein|nr:hypothetical protein [Treponema sp.]
MKRTYLYIFLAIFASCASSGPSKSLGYPQPAFDKPFVYVIDTFKITGSFEDYVKLHNNSNESNIKFNVYVHHPGNHEWLIYGTGILKGSGDTDTIDSGIDDLDDYRYFAIESLNDKDFRYQLYKNHNDLHISILDN